MRSFVQVNLASGIRNLLSLLVITPSYVFSLARLMTVPWLQFCLFFFFFIQPISWQSIVLVHINRGNRSKIDTVIGNGNAAGKKTSRFVL